MRTSATDYLEHSEEGRAFLQRRVGLFLAANGLLGFGFLLYRVLTVATLMGDDRGRYLTDGSMLTHVGATVVFSAGWWLVGRGRRKAASIRRIEATSFLGASALYIWMTSYIPPMGRPDLVVLLILTFAMFARSMFVPSEARITAMYCAVLAVPLAVNAFFMYYGSNIALYAELPELMGQHATNYANWSATRFAIGPALETLAWWAAASSLSIATTSVIYGLRREVREKARLGQYTLGTKIGEGGMGVVYRAHHAMLRRPTAVKLLPPDKVGERSVARFEREVQHTAELTHPNTITIYDYGRTPDGIFYYAMEFLDGCTLTDVVDFDGPQPAGRVVRILLDAAGALAEAHGKNLIHRDIKPSNIMLIVQGGVYDVAKVLDFGLVKTVSRETTASLTGANLITGTPQYMAPESISDPEAVDNRSDLYALAAVGYYLLVGEHVFDGNSAVEVCSAHLYTDPTPPSERLGEPVDRRLERAIMRCLAKEPGQRPQSAGELMQELRACTASDWDDDRAREWWATVGAEIRTHRQAGSESAGHEALTVLARGRSTTGH